MDTFADSRWAERADRVMVAMAFEAGDETTGRLLDAEGLAATLTLARGDGPVPGLSGEQVDRWRGRAHVPLDLAQVDQVIAQSEHHGLRILIPGDAEWPAEVDQLGPRTPVALWAKGRVSVLADPDVARIAVVGARAATSYGQWVATEMAADLAADGVQVVSGGAYGIDAAAHRAAILNGTPTLAVLPTGLDHPFPVGNTALFNRIAEAGLLISEIPPGATPTRSRIQQKSRLLAALSDAVLVVEAGRNSGTFWTVSEAGALGRPVGAVPGPVTSAASAGCNWLIQSGAAHLITRGPDILTFLLNGTGRLGQQLDVSGKDRAAPITSPTSDAGLSR